MSFQSTDRFLKTLWGPLKLIVLPLIFSLLILFALVASVHFYRMAYAPGVNFSPLTPKAQRSFSFQVPIKNIPDPAGSSLILKIAKEQDSFGSARYWHVGKTVLSLPLVVSSCGICIRLALWDPGVYRVSLLDVSGHKIFTSLVTVIAPLALYRDDVILVFFVVFLSWASGKFAISILGQGRLSLANELQKKIRLVIIGAGLVALGLIFVPYPEIHHVSGSEMTSLPMGGTSLPADESSTLESEGRRGALPLPLSPVGQSVSSGYLIIRHHMDSWTEFGRTLTVFEGAIGVLGKKNSFFLPPDDGRYFLTLWSPDTSGKSLLDFHWVIRSIPVSPELPAALLSGLALFSFSGFLWGFLLRNSASVCSGK